MTPNINKERILIVTEAQAPQINGVVRTAQATRRELLRLGHDVLEVGPDTARWPLTLASREPNVYLEFFAQRRLKKIIEDFNPTCRHIETEGPLGRAARRIFMKTNVPFTTSYHTRWPEFAQDRMPRFMKRASFKLAYAHLRNFHAPARAVMTPTSSMMRELEKRGFRNLKLWERGVDTDFFRPRGPQDTPPREYAGLPRPLLVYFGRVAEEKNLEAFLGLTQGSKIVVGEGKALDKLRRQFPDALYPGTKEDKELVRYCAAADLCVFPSKNDTFGLTLLEAAAMGLRIAAYRAPGPVDIFDNEGGRKFAALDDNLQKAVDCALNLPQNPEIAREFIRMSRYSWSACTAQFLANMKV